MPPVAAPSGLDDLDAFDVPGAADPGPTEAVIVARIRPTVERRAALAAMLDVKKLEVEALEADVKRIDQSDLPAILDELGVTAIELELPDGTRLEIEVADHVHASLAQRDMEKRRRGLAFLKENYASVVKRGFSVKFGNSKMEREVAERFAAYLKQFPTRIQIEDKDDVHQATLKSLVQELIKRGEAPPDVLEILGAHITRCATVTIAK